MIYSTKWYGIGDLWALVSHLTLQQQKVLLSTYHGRKGLQKDYKEIICDFLKVIALDTQQIILTDQKVTDPISFSVEEHSQPYVDVVYKWKPNLLEKTVCIQLESTSTHSRDRFIPSNEQQFLLDWLKEKGYRIIDLKSKAQPIEEKFKALASCHVFIGIDSAPSHFAHAVGTPCFLKHWSRLDQLHPNKRYVKYNSIQNLCMIMEQQYDYFLP